jgi:GntR family transcriptional regulator, rspAB operon transcriptional repressor
MTLDIYKSPALSEKICQVLKDRIISGKYRPKTMLLEKEICKEFGVSRTPFRDAIKKLGELKLVEVVPRFGTYVSEVNLHEVRDAFEIRSVLEPLAARLAAERREPEELSKLETLIREGDTLVEAGGAILHRNSLDKGCHEAIHKAAHNAILAVQLDTLHTICARIWTSAMREDISVAEIVSQWERIYSAVKDGNIDAAGAFMTEHMSYTAEHLRKGFF